MLTVEVKLLKTMDTSITGGAEYTVMSLFGCSSIFIYFCRLNNMNKHENWVLFIQQILSSIMVGNIREFISLCTV